MDPLGQEVQSTPWTWHESEPGHDAGSERTNTKRRRISLACNACRTRKSRCSGDHPCSLCQQLGFVCQYQPSPSATNLIVRKDVVEDFEERLKALEAQVGRGQEHSEAVTEPSTASFAPNHPLHGDEAHHQQRLRNDGQLSDQTNNAPHHVSKLEDSGNSPNNHETLNNMTIDLTEGKDSAFFGPSSNIAFMRQIMRVTRRVEAKNVSQSFLDDPSSVNNGPTSVRRLASSIMDSDPKRGVRHVNMRELPPDTELEALIEHYFLNAGCLYPYLHEATFRTNYQQMKSNHFTRVRRTWLALLNIVLATSVRDVGGSSKPLQQRKQEANVYYNRALQLCGDDMYRGTSLEIAQCLLLMAQYLQSTQDSVQTWSVHGLVVKAAMSLGSHSVMAVQSHSVIEQEMRIRVWWGCMVLDRTLGMTFGRPWAIPQANIRIRRPMAFPDDQYLSARRSAPYVESSVQFFNATLSLYEIMTKIISSLYDDNLGSEQDGVQKQILPQIVSIAEELEEWWDKVPSAVRWHPDSKGDPGDEQFRIGQRFRNILKIRFLNLQLLLYRPVLMMAIGAPSPTKEDQDHSLSRQLLTTCVGKCVQCSILIIDMIHEAVTPKNGHPELLGATWFTLYYLFNAALVLFAGFTMVPDLLSLSWETYPLSFARAIEALEHLDPGDRMTRACAEYLKRLVSSSGAKNSRPPIPHTAPSNGGPTFTTPHTQGPARANTTHVPPAMQFSAPTRTLNVTQLPPLPDTTYNQYDIDFSLPIQEDLNLAQFYSQEDFESMLGTELTPRFGPVSSQYP